MKPIYVASRASLPERPAMWRTLRDTAGWPINSTWIDEAGPEETKSFPELWKRISAEVTAARGVILYAEPEDFPLKGAYIEVGMALGQGKRIGVVLPGVDIVLPHIRPVGSWVRHPLVKLCGGVLEAREWLDGDGVPDQRARFESWAARTLGIGNFDRTQDEDADYLNPDTNDLWRCWQEAACGVKDTK